MHSYCIPVQHPCRADDNQCNGNADQCKTLAKLMQHPKSNVSHSPASIYRCQDLVQLRRTEACVAYPVVNTTICLTPPTTPQPPHQPQRNTDWFQRAILGAQERGPDKHMKVCVHMFMSASSIRLYIYIYIYVYIRLCVSIPIFGNVWVYKQHNDYTRQHSNKGAARSAI